MLPPKVTGDRVVLESVSRQAAHAVRSNGDAIICRGFSASTSSSPMPTNYTVAPQVALDGYWEPWMTLAIARAIRRPGAHAVDVGAKHGYFTLLLARRQDPRVVSWRSSGTRTSTGLQRERSS